MDYYRVLGITSLSGISDVKKAYRKLAKQNHPDRFANPEQKAYFEKRMSLINEAYQAVLAGKAGEPKEEKAKKESDTDLYKKAVSLFNLYRGSISLKFKDIANEINTLLEKKKNIEEARNCFRELLLEYPDSDWAFDSEEKLRLIEKNLPNLDKNIEFVRTHSIGRTKKGTPIWKEK